MRFLGAHFHVSSWLSRRGCFKDHPHAGGGGLCTLSGTSGNLAPPRDGRRGRDSGQCHHSSKRQAYTTGKGLTGVWQSLPSCIILNGPPTLAPTVAKGNFWKQNQGPITPILVPPTALWTLPSSCSSLLPSPPHSVCPRLRVSMLLPEHAKFKTTPGPPHMCAAAFLQYSLLSSPPGGSSKPPSLPLCTTGFKNQSLVIGLASISFHESINSMKARLHQRVQQLCLCALPFSGV